MAESVNIHPAYTHTRSIERMGASNGATKELLELAYFIVFLIVFPWKQVRGFLDGKEISEQLLHHLGLCARLVDICFSIFACVLGWPFALSGGSVPKTLQN